MMHHPRPQHPLPTREFRYDSYEPQRNQYSFSRSATSAVKSFALSAPAPTHVEGSAMMVESPQYAYPPPSLAHSGNYGPSSTQYSSTTYQGFQSPPQSYDSRLPPQSPTYALRPAQSNNVFSHIEHPPTSSGDPVDPASSDDDDEGHRSRATTPHHSRRHMRTSSRPQNPYGYPAAYEYEAQETFGVDNRSQVDRGMSQAEAPNPYALNRLSAGTEAEAPIGALRHRTRGRGGSESSVGSVVSSAAVVGDAIYRTDSLYDSMGAHSNRQTGAHFQPQTAPATYSHNFSNDGRPMEFQEQVPQPMAPGVESPYIPPPSPQQADEQGDHPFVYKGADWDYPLRSLRTATTASTDTDAMSLDGRGRSSSRESSEDAGGRRSKKDKKTAQAPANANGEGKRKTVMACHFCRFRKLRCDGGSPCGHCEKRDKECTYDATIRRRGPGRKNKSAQETARVQLAQRQREEADRESKAQGSKTKAQRHGSMVMTMPVEKRDASMQTSPRTNQYPAASSQGDRYYAASNRYLASAPSRHVGPSPGHDVRSPTSQHMVPSSTGVTSAFSSPAEFQMQFRPPHDPPPRPQERQAFTIPFQHEPTTVPEVFPTSLAHQQQSQQYTPQQYGGSPHGHLAYGLQTPASTAPSSFYGNSPDRQSNAEQQQMYPYASSSYSQGQEYGSSRYQGDAHTDTESMYAYSEGANVMPSRYGQLPVPPPPRSDVQAPYGRETTYADEDVEHAGASRSDRGWDKTLRMRR
ncbi:hypothetical protein FRC08_010825 [Ceratobasidium sp. 394]|nr:hypothetical protein FRC08_010825 [Ceratobasidium sp. 394]